MKILLGTICIALLGLFAYLVMSFPLSLDELQDVDHSAINGDLSKDLNFELPQLAILNSIDEYSEIIQRPLFVKNRVPARGAQAFGEVVTASELEHLILVGIATSADVSIGIVADSKEKQMERLKVDQVYKGWKVAEIAKDHIVFQNDNLEYKLFLTTYEQRNNKRRSELTGKTAAKPISTKKASYKGWARNATSKQGSLEKNNTYEGGYKDSEVESHKKVAGSIWNYQKNEAQAQEDVATDGPKVIKPPVRRSPIKIPGDDEGKDASYYEALDEEGAEGSAVASDWQSAVSEITEEDFYGESEEITEDELKALEALGAIIFDE
ncbi:MAG: hypothetical protein O6852_03005 [Gammaproteobacteria bacterium]|nr:hypothetical protein [Gammaproteobacteria bacterium]